MSCLHLLYCLIAFVNFLWAGNPKNLDFHQIFQSIFLYQKNILQRKYERSHRVVYEMEEIIEIGVDTAKNEPPEVA